MVRKSQQRQDGDVVNAAKSVLAGASGYDDLSERGQAAARSIWDEQISERRTGLNLAAEFTQAGRSWTEADARGNAVVHRADSPFD